MKKILVVLTIIVCGLPAAGVAEASKSDGAANATKACKELRARLGDAAFKATYGTNVNRSNAFGKCVSKTAKTLAGSGGNS